MVLFRTSEKVRKLANVDKVDWCDLAENLRSSKNLFFKKIFEEFKEAAPSAFRSCPVIGRYEVFNFTLGKALVKMIPIGGYTVKLIATDNLINYYNLTVSLNVNSS